MSVPRVIVAGVEPGPAVDLVAGALLAGLGELRAARPVLLGLDLPLWRLLYDLSSRSPRAIDPVLFSRETVLELYDHWASETDLVLFVAVRPLLEAWEGVEGSRPSELAARLDVPVVLALDARERGASAAAAVYGSKLLAGEVEIGGIILVGADESPASRELADVLRREVRLPLLGSVPPQLTDQFMRQHASSGRVRTVGPGPAREGASHLCREAAGYLDLEAVLALAAQRGYLPAPPRRLLAAQPNAGGLAVAVAWGPPLQPLVLENIDLLQAAGVRLVPLNLARDSEVPGDVDGLVLLGQLDEGSVQPFAENVALVDGLRAAVDEGLPTLAMGGGALLLLQRLSDSRGRSYELLGLAPAEAELIESYDRPHYVDVSATRQNPYDEGRHTMVELFDLEFSSLEQGDFAYQVETPDGARAEGFVVRRCLATTLYGSFVGDPQFVARFVSVMQLLRAR
jgi:cobyrinic acid a,c-diamide synthase